MISETRRIQKNSLYLFISTFSRLVTNSLLFIIIARYFGVEIFGSFTAAHTLSSMFLVLADFGFDILITTEVARNIENPLKIFQKFVPIKILFSSIALILLWITSVLIPGSSESKNLIFLFGFNMFFTTLTNVIFAFFRGIEQFKYEAIVSFTINLILLVSILYFSALNVSIYTIVIIIGGLRLIGLILSFIIFKSKTKYSFKNFSLNNLTREVKMVLIFGFHLLFGTIYFQIDTVLLMSIKGDSVAGSYQAAFKLMMIVLFLPELFIGILLPTITRLYSHNDFKWKQISNFLFKVLFLISLPISFILFQYPREILFFVYGQNDFFSADIILKFAAVIIFIRFCVEPFAMILTVRGKQYKRTIIVFVASIFSIILNLLLIPKYGIHASISISLFINLIVGIAYAIMVKPIIITWLKDFKYILPIILICFSYYFTNLLPNTPIWIIIPLFLISYLIITYNVNLNSSEKKLLFSLKNKRI